MEFEDNGLDWKLVGVNFSLFFIVSGISFSVRFLIEPFQRGYFIEDTSIRWPHAAGMINIHVVFLLVSVTGKIMFSIVEYLHARPYPNLPKRRIFRKHHIAEWSWQSSLANIRFIYTLFWLVFVVNVAKITLGRLSPNFLAVCQPMPAWISSNKTDFVNNYVCMNPNVSQLEILESKSSFPNLQAAILLYGTTFFILYFARRFSCRFSFVLPTIQITLLSVAMFICLKCVRDNWAHASDVIAGAILGISLAVILYKNHFKFKDYSSINRPEKINNVVGTFKTTLTTY